MFKRFYIVMLSVLKKIKWILTGDKKEQQIELFIPNSNIKNNIKYKVPEEYTLKRYNKIYEGQILQLYNEVRFKFDKLILLNAMYLCVPSGIFVIVHNKTEKVVAAFMARHLSDEIHPIGGRIDWLAVDPEHRDKHLGFIVTAACVNRLVEIGYHNIYVTTDDDRLGAIKTFLKAGFVPNLFSEEMHSRWEMICNLLEIPFQPKEWNISKEELDSY